MLNGKKIVYIESKPQMKFNKKKQQKRQRDESHAGVHKKTRGSLIIEWAALSFHANMQTGKQS